MFDWHQRMSARSRVRYQVSEALVLVLSAAVTITGIVFTHRAWIPAVISAVVALIAGSRAIFHFRDDWLRHSVTFVSLKAEIRRYQVGAAPYDDPVSRQARLVDAVSQTEMQETTSWTTLAGPGSSEQPTA